MLLSRLGAFPELPSGLERTDVDLLRRHAWPRLVPLRPVDDRAGLECRSHDRVRSTDDDLWEPDSA